MNDVQHDIMTFFARRAGRPAPSRPESQLLNPLHAIATYATTNQPLALGQVSDMGASIRFVRDGTAGETTEA